MSEAENDNAPPKRIGRPPGARDKRPRPAPQGHRRRSTMARLAATAPEAPPRPSSRDESPFDGTPHNAGAGDEEGDDDESDHDGAAFAPEEPPPREPDEVDQELPPEQAAEMILETYDAIAPMLAALRYPDDIAQRMKLHPLERASLHGPLVATLRQHTIRLDPTTALVVTAGIIVGGKILGCEGEARRWVREQQARQRPQREAEEAAAAAAPAPMPA